MTIEHQYAGAYQLESGKYLPIAVINCSPDPSTGWDVRCNIRSEFDTKEEAIKCAEENIEKFIADYTAK